MQLLIFETHPVQYRTPIYQKLNQLVPGAFEVVFASDFSVQGYHDPQFNTHIAWDNIRLQEFPHRVLNRSSRAVCPPWERWMCAEVAELIAKQPPAAILLHAFNNRFGLTAFAAAQRRKIPVWLRTEAEDASIQRGLLKSLSRSFLYRQFYARIDRCFAIGEGNLQHYLRHGVTSEKIRAAKYCTDHPCSELTEAEKWAVRRSVRNQLAIDAKTTVVAFFGKLISKKNPEVIFEAWLQLEESLKSKTHILFVGAGELESSLRRTAEMKKIPASFLGFINQSRLGRFYLAADILVLPSRRQGETWGLVVNEALQCGCSVIASDAVGCSLDFHDLSRFRLFSVGDSGALAQHICELSTLTRDFNWAMHRLENYSVQAAAEAIAREIVALPTRIEA